VSPKKQTLTVIQDVKTRWWSTHMMLERVIALKESLQNMFEFEYKNRESKNKPTILEQYELREDDYQFIADIARVLEPFKDIQKALEGDKYPTLSLVPLLVHQLREKLIGMIAAAPKDTHADFLCMLTELKDDLDTRWGTTTSYSPEVVRGDRNRQISVPKLAFWASILDPRTKKR
jgi:hypothetical protein